MSVAQTIAVRLGLTGRGQFEAEMKRAEVSARKSFSGMEASAKQVQTAFLGMKGVLAGLGIGLLIKSSIDEFIAAEQSSENLRFAIERQNKSWGEWGERLTSFAKARQMRTIFEDDETLRAMQIMITKGIEVEHVIRAVTAAQDIAKATGESQVAVADALAKANSGVTRALFALLPQFKELDTEGMELSEVLGLVEVRLGGMAEQTGDVATQRMKRFSAAVGDLKEEIGAILLLRTGGAQTDLIVLLERMAKAINEVSFSTNYSDEELKMVRLSRTIEHLQSNSIAQNILGMQELGQFTDKVWGKAFWTKNVALDIAKQELAAVQDEYQVQQMMESQLRKNADIKVASVEKRYTARFDLSGSRGIMGGDSKGYVDPLGGTMEGDALGMRKSLNERIEQLIIEGQRRETDAIAKGKADREEIYRQEFEVMQGLLVAPMTDFFVSIVGHANLTKAAFSNMINSMVASIERLIVQALLLEGLFQVLGFIAPSTAPVFRFVQGYGAGAPVKGASMGGSGGGNNSSNGGSINITMTLDGEKIYRSVRINDEKQRRRTEQ